MPPDPIELDAQIVTRASARRPLLAPIVGALTGIISLLPTWAPTARGRRARRTWRFSAFALGILFLLGAAQSRAWLLLTALCFAFALIAPIRPEIKRHWLRRAGALAYRTVQRTRPARLTHDGRRLALYEEGRLVRRVLTDRSFFARSMRDPGGALFIRLAPKAKSPRKDEIVIEFEDVRAPPDAELAPKEVESVRVRGGEPIARILLQDQGDVRT